MQDDQMTIVSNESVARNTYEMVLQSEHVSQTAIPGQFLHIAIPNFTLRRPLSIATINREKETVTIVYKVVGAGTKQLSTFREGVALNVMGPNGNGFDLEINEKTTVLLIGGGVGIPPLHFLGKQLSEKGVTVKSILGFQSQEDIFYENSFKTFGKTLIVTDDGSYGKKGLVTDVISEINDFDTYYTCGPLPMIQAVTKQLAHKEGYISLEERMGCGIGACYACVIPTTIGVDYRKICEDGPVFAAQEVKL
ncbi:MAG TPA: dihydroorotate dehydrogenase electron transfer subunit [Bacillota bacterium]|nr:dihydroorotate dehydrogenase electron transfer subunit [Bacillota bacterium]